MEYCNYALIFKALGDSTRVEIIDMLKGGGMCACKILEKFNITQPTLSYHMKILCRCGIVECRKEGIWNHYKINKAVFDEMTKFLKADNKLENNKCVCRK